MLDRQTIQSLKAQAHPLKPELTIGKEGLNAALFKSIAEAFHTKELLKVKALDTCPEDRGQLKEKFSSQKDIFLIQNIGHTFVLYKKMEEKPGGGDGRHQTPKVKPIRKSEREGGASAPLKKARINPDGGPKSRR